MVTSEGLPVSSSLEPELTVEVGEAQCEAEDFPQYGGLVSQLVRKVEAAVRDIDKTDQLVQIWAQSVRQQVTLLHTAQLIRRKI